MLISRALWVCKARSLKMRSRQLVQVSRCRCVEVPRAASVDAVQTLRIRPRVSVQSVRAMQRNAFGSSVSHTHCQVPRETGRNHVRAVIIITVCTAIGSTKRALCMLEAVIIVCPKGRRGSKSERMSIQRFRLTPLDTVLVFRCA